MDTFLEIVAALAILLLLDVLILIFRSAVLDQNVDENSLMLAKLAIKLNNPLIYIKKSIKWTCYSLYYLFNRPKFKVGDIGVSIINQSIFIKILKVFKGDSVYHYDYVYVSHSYKELIDHKSCNKIRYIENEFKKANKMEELLYT